MLHVPVPVSSIHRSCQPPGAAPYFDHGYIASPNYPSKYYMDAECTWSLAVQPRQTIRVIIFDFELDVKKGGNCFDYLEIETRGQTVFKDCGALGKQSITVDSSTSLIRFKTGQSSPTQRGFFIYFEGDIILLKGIFCKTQIGFSSIYLTVDRGY